MYNFLVVTGCRSVLFSFDLLSHAEGNGDLNPPIPEGQAQAAPMEGHAQHGESLEVPFYACVIGHNIFSPLI